MASLTKKTCAITTIKHTGMGLSTLPPNCTATTMHIYSAVQNWFSNAPYFALKRWHETFVSHQLLNGGEKQFIYKLCPKYLCITRPICPQFKNKHLYIAINAKVLISRVCGAFQFAPPPPPLSSSPSTWRPYVSCGCPINPRMRIKGKGLYLGHFLKDFFCKKTVCRRRKKLAYLSLHFEIAI